jgi:hypothetical protein
VELALEDNQILFYSPSKLTPSLSQISTPGRSFTQPNSGTAGYNYNTGSLANLLTKREYIYKEYLLNKGYTINLPKYLRASPSNPLFEDVKTGYFFADPALCSTELARGSSDKANYTNINVLKYKIIKNALNTFNNDFGLNTTPVLDRLITLSINDQETASDINRDLFKNQYRPLKKGISNMVRLQATGAIAMPIEMRLHILASSKDVIHSWSIPSAGVKIDCVPGFSTHRVTIFLVSGTF